jgi:hypothetical protein
LDSFHDNCDYKGSTITFIRSHHNKIFGGYTSLSWESRNTYRRDKNAFIFSLSNKTKHLQYRYKYASIGDHYNYLPCFGNNNDIVIYDNCNSNESSLCNFGYTYDMSPM